MTSKRTILVTSALPYANSSLHIGHIVEYVQTDIWVRFQRLRGHDLPVRLRERRARHADDAARRRRASTPEELIERVSADHRRDFATFGSASTTTSRRTRPENQELTTELYRRLAARGFIARKTIKQAYDEERQMFLPDRYVRGTCPNCGTPDQYGDSCENCGATYSPLDLKDAVSTLSGTKPAARESEHLFLSSATSGGAARVGAEARRRSPLARKLDEWFKARPQGLGHLARCALLRLRIPGERDKFFYVWFDAPIGYMASFLQPLPAQRPRLRRVLERPAADTSSTISSARTSRISTRCSGPRCSSGAGYRMPSDVYMHGYLTVDGEKMSKRSGTFIPARRLREASRSRLSALLLRLEARFDDRGHRSQLRGLRREGELAISSASS